MKQKSPKTAPLEALNAEQIESWLYDHPDFFAQHLNLLENLTIPHPSGKAVSLVSRQLDLLRDKNRKLSHQLENLIQIAKENDGLFRRMQQLTLALMETKELEETVAVLTAMLQDCFTADFVSLKIIAEPSENLTAVAGLFISPDDEQLGSFEKIITSDRPKCGHSAQSQALFLFGENGKEALSSAIVPLKIGEYSGLLGIGSIDKERFQASMGNLFLDHIGELVSSRLIALINR